MSSHEAGSLHAQGQAPAWLEVPEDVNALLTPIWPATAFKPDQVGDAAAKGVLQVGGLTVAQIAEQVGTPAYVIDETDFRSRAQAFAAEFERAFAHLAGAHVHYAAKSLITVGIAGWLAQDGLAVDVCSGGELEIVLRGGILPQRITFHGSNKSDEELAQAMDLGVDLIVIDSLAEIDQVARLAAAGGWEPPVMLRCSIGIEAHTHEFIATSHEDQKFGLSVADGSAMAGVRRVLEHPALRLRGIHTHIGSQIFDTEAFRHAISRMARLTAQIEREHDLVLPELGLGGGFGVPYTTGHDPAGPAEIADGMAGYLERECRAEGIAVPHVTVEPGRAIAGPAGITLYTVGTVKPVTLDGGFTRLYVSVDGGMSDNIRTALYGADYSATLASRYSTAPPQLARVVGKHCESGDIVVKDEYLPADIAAGDLLAVPVTGAYCHSMSSNYNAIRRPPIVSVKDGLLTVLVRRESMDDLLARDLYA
ncbi:MAG: diaminopimelate decarboxylase [Bifidobacteriaceae bacterium]|jgi:diaminopimelate decarboxylase|nr:diaminopimelate decarboxylase [Bifidobacteriaceae bacterium]